MVLGSAHSSTNAFASGRLSWNGIIRKLMDNFSSHADTFHLASCTCLPFPRRSLLFLVFCSISLWRLYWFVVIDDDASTLKERRSFDLNQRQHHSYASMLRL